MEVCAFEMCVQLGVVLTGVGLLMNIVGVTFLTIVDLFTSKPIRMWWFYHRYVDRESPEDTQKDAPADIISPVGGGFAGLPIPDSAESYDSKKRMMRNQSIAAIGLIGGFIFQFFGLLV